MLDVGVNVVPPAGVSEEPLAFEEQPFHGDGVLGQNLEVVQPGRAVYVRYEAVAENLPVLFGDTTPNAPYVGWAFPRVFPPLRFGGFTKG